MSGVLKSNRLRQWTGLCLAALVVLCFSCRSSLREDAGVPLTELHGNLDLLRTAFNEDVGKVRLMLLLDPTGGVCLRGASEVEEHVMERISDPNLRAYIVWLPVLPSGAHEAAAQRETKRIRDNRAVQFFDAEARVGKVYSSILHLPSGLPAWDVYLVFGAEVRWESNPPVPAYWMHQLGRAGPPELRLDGEQLERVVRSLLPKTAGAIPSPGSLRPGALSPKGVGVKTAGSGSGHAFQARRTQRFVA